MINRRDALRLGTAALLVPVGKLPFNSAALASMQLGADYPVGRGNAARTGETPGPAPRLDEQLIVRWKFAAHGDDSNNTFDDWITPAVVNGVIYAGGRDNLLYAIDATSGTELWSFAVEGNLRDTPAVHNGLIFVTCWGPNVYAIDAASGEERWRYFVGAMSTWGVVADDSTVYLSDGSNIRALTSDTGEERWLFRPEGIASGPALDNGTIFINSLAGVHAIDAISGEELWMHPAGSAFILPPAIVDGVVYAGDFNHELHALDSKSGAEAWRFSPVPPSDSTGYNQHLSVRSVIDGTVMASGDGILYAVDSETGLERWRISSDTTIVPTAMVVDGSALVVDDGLYMVDVVSGQELWRDYRYQDDGLMRSLISSVMIDGIAYVGYNDHVYALGNLPMARLIADVILRGAPSSTGIERGVASAGDDIDTIGVRNTSAGQEWVEVTIGEVTGWIPLEAIDPATLVPDDGVEYVYVPE